MTGTGNGFLTVRELAEFAGVRESTVLWWLHVGEAPASGRVYGRTVFRAEDVDAWRDQTSRASAPSESLAVARASSAMSSSTSLASSRVFADAGAAA